MALRENSDGINGWHLFRRALTAGVFLAAVGAYLLSATRDPRIDTVRSSVVDFMEPVLSAVSRPLRSLNLATSDFGGFLDVYEHNRKLREDIVALSRWREIALRLEAENAQLRSLNKVTLAPRFDYITAQVIGNSDGVFTHSITINAGRKDGVRPGTVIMDGTAIVGRVVSLGESASRVLLLTDAKSRIPAMVQDGDAEALLIGDNTIEPELRFISKPGNLRRNQRVLTSNHGGVFPKGLPLGRIVEAVDGKARIKLDADFRHLEFVRLVIERSDLSIDADAVLIVEPDEE